MEAFAITQRTEAFPDLPPLRDSAGFQELNITSAEFLQVSVHFPRVFAQREEQRGTRGKKADHRGRFTRRKGEAQECEFCHVTEDEGGNRMNNAGHSL